MLMGMGLGGWILALLLGFVIGGVFFLSVKAQVEYVVDKRGPTWLMPVALYARMAFLGAVLVLVAVFVPGECVPAALLAGLIGALVARVLVTRSVRRRGAEEANDEPV